MFPTPSDPDLISTPCVCFSVLYLQGLETVCQNGYSSLVSENQYQ